MLAVIGGSGFYQMAGAHISARRMDTPFGEPSAAVAVLTDAAGRQTLFLPRHGTAHGLLPSEINYRANIWALKKAGARQIIAVSACGSLREEIRPGDFIIPTQYFDHTRGMRPHTFFGGGLVAHVSSAQPACPALSQSLAAACQTLGFAVHQDKTYACVEGPRLGTRAESFFLRDAVRADIVGMTNVPEVFLAMEAQMSYATLAVCTDYDCWMDEPAQHASVAAIIKRFGESIGRARQVVAALSQNLPPIDEARRCAAAAAVMTPAAAHTAAHRELLEVLLA